MGDREYSLYSLGWCGGTGRSHHRPGEIVPKTKGPRNQIVIVDGQPKVAVQIDRMAAIEKAELYIVKKLPQYLRKIHALAMGITAIKETKDGPMIYNIPPDRIALEYLVDRGLGRTPQRHEVTGQDGGPMAVIPWMPASALSPVDESKVIEGEVTNVEMAAEDASDTGV